MDARPLFVSLCCSLALLTQGCFLDRSPLPEPGPHDAGLDAGQGPVDGGGAEEMDAQVPQLDGGPDGGDAGARDGGAPDTGVVDAGCGGIAPSCDEEGRRVECVGGVIVTTPCPLGCVTGVCRGIVPSNVGGAVRMDAGSRALTGTALLFNTDDGRITDGEAEVRPAGEGVLADIAYQPLPGGGDDAPGLGVFVVGSLNLPATATLRAEGSRAFVLLVNGDASIAGTVDVSSDGIEGGPGGWRGHEGRGKGGNGAHSDSNTDDSGAGGGGFGTAGGGGGPSGDRTPGAAGGVYGTEELVPLVGGSGGGRGGRGWRIDNAHMGGTGGGGGGAVQISAGGTLTVTVSGVIDAGGAAGAGGRKATIDSGAGGGGGSGGAILLEALEVEMSGTLAVNGGGGGQGVTCTGCCSVTECGSSAESGAHGDAFTVPAPGGGTGTAQAGGAGSNPGGNASPGGGAENGGGGGGGAGRVRINAESPADVAVSGAIYPAATYTTGTITIGP